MIRAYQKIDDEAIVDTWYRASLLAHPFLEADFLEKEKKSIRELYLPNTKTWVYEEGGEVVGFIAMLGNEVGAIFVQPACQGRGIGTQLMDLMAQTHPELEVEVFEKNSKGRAFYKKYGFRFLKEYIHEASNENMWRLRYKREG